jgi:hypothetical protein
VQIRNMAIPLSSGSCSCRILLSSQRLQTTRWPPVNGDCFVHRLELAQTVCSIHLLRYFAMSCLCIANNDPRRANASNRRNLPLNEALIPSYVESRASRVYYTVHAKSQETENAMPCHSYTLINPSHFLLDLFHQLHKVCLLSLELQGLLNPLMRLLHTSHF